MPHTDPPMPVLAEGGFRGGGAHLPRLRRPPEPGSRQQAGRLPHALLRFAEYGEPAFLRRDLQQDEPGRPFSCDRLVGLHRSHTRRSEPAPRACLRLRRQGTLPQVHPVPFVRQHDRELPVSLRDRPALLGVSLHRPQRLGGAQLAESGQPQNTRRPQGRPRLRGAEARRLRPGVSPLRLDQERASRRADRLRGQETRHQGQVPQLPRGARALEQEPAARRLAARRRRPG